MVKADMSEEKDAGLRVQIHPHPGNLPGWPLLWQGGEKFRLLCILGKIEIDWGIHLQTEQYDTERTSALW